MSTFERVRKIICEQLGFTAEEVKPESRFDEDLHADSLDAVDMTMGIEEEFGIMLQEEQVEKMKTVRQAVEVIEQMAG